MYTHTNICTKFAKGQRTHEKMFYSYWSSGKYKVNHTLIPLPGMAEIKNGGKHQVVGNPHILLMAVSEKNIYFLAHIWK